MIKLGENNFLLARSDGSEVPFSAAELQGELIYCFLSAGLRDSSCFAEDIALAVEYSLHEKYCFNGRINSEELTAMVVETLENSGFFTVADWFKRRNGREIETLYDTDMENLHEIAVRQGMLLGADDADAVLKNAVKTFQFMGRKEYPMSLIVEILRFFYMENKNSLTDNPEKKRKKFKGDYIVELKDVAGEFSDFLQPFLDSGVLKVNSISVYHPSIRLFLNCTQYAEFCGLEGVMTEMLWQEHSIKIARCMDNIIEIMQTAFEKKCNGKKLPVYLTVNNLERFMEQYFGVDTGNAGKLAASLVESLSSEMFYSIYKVRF